MLCNLFKDQSTLKSSWRYSRFLSGLDENFQSSSICDNQHHNPVFQKVIFTNEKDQLRAKLQDNRDETLNGVYSSDCYRFIFADQLTNATLLGLTLDAFRRGQAPQKVHSTISASQYGSLEETLDYAASVDPFIIQVLAPKSHSCKSLHLELNDIPTQSGAPYFLIWSPSGTPKVTISIHLLPSSLKTSEEIEKTKGKAFSLFAPVIRVLADKGASIDVKINPTLFQTSPSSSEEKNSYLPFINQKNIYTSDRPIQWIGSVVANEESLVSISHNLGGGIKSVKADINSAFFGFQKERATWRIFVKKKANVKFLQVQTASSTQIVESRSDVSIIGEEALFEQKGFFIARQKGQSLWNGVIQVHKGAKEANISQNIKGLVLSPQSGSKIHCLPVLDVMEPDVSGASHGVAIGTIEEETIFYLRSRGLSVDQAEKLIAKGFLSSAASRF